VRTPVLLATLLGISIAAGACYAYRPVPVAPAAGSRVRIVLTSVALVTVMAPGREDTRRTIPGVLEATGRLEAAASDTVALRLGELRTAAGAVPDVADQVALVPTAQIARIEERRFQAGTTLLAGAGLSLVVFSAFIVLLIVVVVRSAA
jgi:hypothetical protein